MTINEYIQKIDTRYQTGISREHSYRGDLQTLLETLCPHILVTNEPARVKCGAPDYVLTKDDIPVGYIEAKDIADKDLQGKKANKEQFNRYKASLDNLIFTDYLTFLLYKDGGLVETIELAEIQNGRIVARPDQFDRFTAIVQDFATHIGQTIKSSAKLSKMMAGKARLLANVIENAITSDEENQQNSTLQEQMQAFKHILIHDITPKGFADIYAQTIAYGMFAARLHDDTLDDFSRQEAAKLIPKSNPFLRNLFQYISGYDIDDRIEWIVTALADIFRATDVKSILNNFGESTQMTDPIIHFYENFLAEYDPKLRKARGVWYTPAPVVNFIVRAVDDILKTEFGLPQGLADNSKTKIKVKAVTKATADRRSKTKEVEVEKEVHKVQILDPATGTGTFLAEIVKHIYNSRFKAMQGVWSSYVENDLIPRLNGFELLMASYAMAHLNLDLLLTETGYKKEKDQRFHVYLTNSLEESHPDTGTLFASWLSSEASEANRIKRDAPVMCILGNPPYNGESKNKGEWIMSLMDDYKKEPNTDDKLNEKNSKFLNDDYVKFIRYSQHFIEKNNEGILAFINPHGFLDNPTFRGMRWNLLKTYDKIYTIDLHGNSTKKEVSPDGTPDVNVFDIKQGVSVNIFVKTGKKKAGELGQVYHYDVYGKRQSKYDFLWKNNLKSIKFKELLNKAPMYLMVQKNYNVESAYRKGFGIIEIFKEYSLGVLSKNDKITIDYEKSELSNRINNLISMEENNIREKYNIKKDSRDWVLSNAINDLKMNNSPENYRFIAYRPFDFRWTYFTGKTRGFFAYSQNRIMRNMTTNDNYAIITGRQGQAVGSMTWNLSFITNTISDQNIYYRGGGTVLPIYLNPSNDDLFSEAQRTPNLDETIVNQIAEKINLTFTPEKESDKTTFAPIDILDYIYAVLHSPTYREKYKEFLKIDFPRVPYPKDADTFWVLVALGGELRTIHLLESPKVTDYITGYPIDGDNIITRKITKTSIGFELTNETADTGKVWINDEQYFDSVPRTAWEFYIGGYQPAQKWLKDRKGRELSFDDILHYQKIIVALSETARLMQEIDSIEIE